MTVSVEAFIPADVEIVAMGLDRSNPSAVDQDVHIAEQDLA
jgi:hypothetical protein